MMSSNTFSTIRSRLLEVIKHGTDEARRFKSLEEMTGISGATWRTFWNRTGSPSGEMIEAIATRWPQYAFWIATGATDPVAGHIAPPGASGVLESKNDEIPEAVEYFRYQLKLLQDTKPSVLDTTGLAEAFELIDEAWQEQIARRMPPGATQFTKPISDKESLYEQLTSTRTLSPEYIAAREQLIKEIRSQKHNKLVELRKRKAGKSTEEK
jgi:hypothetical protein